MKIDPKFRNLYRDGTTHAPHPDDPSKPKCGVRVSFGNFRPSLDGVNCRRCGGPGQPLNAFTSWETEHVQGFVNDEGDSVALTVGVYDVPGVENELMLRIKPEDLDRFIARLTEIKEARGL